MSFARGGLAVAAAVASEGVASLASADFRARDRADSMEYVVVICV